MRIEKDEQRLGAPAGILRDKPAEAGTAGVVPDFQPGPEATMHASTEAPMAPHHGFIRDGKVVRRSQLPIGRHARRQSVIPVVDGPVIVAAIVIDTGQAGALRRRVPLT